MKSPASITRQQKRNLGKLFAEGNNFLKNIEPSDNILLIHHTDVDGYCSGAIFLGVLKRLNKNLKIDTYAAANEELENLFKDKTKVKTKNKKIKSYDKIIILDIDAPYLKKEFEIFRGKIFIIDHHTLRSDLNANNIIYINPRFENEEAYQPVSYIIYKFLSSIKSMVDLKEFEWLAVLGTVSDLGFEDCKDLLGKWVKANAVKDLTKTGFWKAGEELYGAIIAGVEKESDVLGLLLESKNLSELKSNPKILSAYNRFHREYEKRKKEFWDNAEYLGGIGNIVISKINSKFKRVGSVLATNIGLENEDKIIILLERRGKFFKVHSRAQSGRAHLGLIMEKCCFEGGGGHRRAAGGTIKTKDFKKFKDCVVKEIGKST